jgi:hypothetical protein
VECDVWLESMCCDVLFLRLRLPPLLLLLLLLLLLFLPLQLRQVVFQSLTRINVGDSGIGRAYSSERIVEKRAGICRLPAQRSQ